jgi:diacylglycerol O-acyltransferase
MNQLSGLDAAFLALETATSTGHVGGVCVLDPSDAPNPLDLALLTELFAQRLDLVPVLRQKLLEVPLGLDQPYWVDDPDFDLEYHIRELALPQPGSDAQLGEQIARLHARPLDRSRPLWEIYLITGLTGGRVVVYTKIHHAAIDGRSGAELLTVLLDLSPGGRELPAPEPFRAGSAPARFALAARAAARLVWRPVETVRLTTGLIRAVPKLAPAITPVVGGLLGLNRGDGDVIRTPAGVAPSTPFNKPITPHRRVAFRSVDLGAVKAVKNAFGVSVNDVVMAMCAGALRRWLTEHDALPSAPLVSMIPVSVRDEASKGALGNRVSAMLAMLPTHIDDPEQRLTLVHEATKLAKSTGRDPAGPGRRHLRLRPAGAGRPGGPGGVRHRAAAPAAAVQPLHLQRPRPERPGIPRRRQAARPVPGLGDHRRPGPQHHAGRLSRPAALRTHRVPGTGAGRRRTGRLPGRRAGPADPARRPGRTDRA